MSKFLQPKNYQKHFQKKNNKTEVIDQKNKGVYEKKKETQKEYIIPLNKTPSKQTESIYSESRLLGIPRKK